METLTLALGDRGYPIHIGEDSLSQLPGELTKLQARRAVAICTDANVAAIHGESVQRLVRSAGLTPVLCIMPAGEEAKQLARIEEFCGMFLEAGLDRRAWSLPSAGASRETLWVRGGHLHRAACGLFKIPRPSWPRSTHVGGRPVSCPLAPDGPSHCLPIIATLWALQANCDLPPGPSSHQNTLKQPLHPNVRMASHETRHDAGLFEYLERHVDPLLNKNLDALMLPVRRSCEIKADVVAEDEKEHGVRAILNYGHTFGHGIEAVTGYGRFLHGEAVALCMHAAAVLAHDLGLIGQDIVNRQQACIEAYGLPARWPALPVEETLAAMKHDKKARAGTLKFILADRVGHVVQRTDIPEERARAALLALR